MGNNACCEEESKAGQFKESKKLALKQLQVQSKNQENKLVSINFTQPPKPPKHLGNPPKLEPIKQDLKSKNNKKSGSNIAPQLLKEQLRKKEERINQVQKIISIPEKQIRHNSQHEEIKSQQLMIASQQSKKPQEIHAIIQQEMNKQESMMLKQKNQPKSQKNQKRQVEKPPELSPPELNSAVKLTLQEQKFFSQQLKFKPSKKIYNDQFYEGELTQDNIYPNGYGKFYKKDGSLYVGSFIKGKANGKGAFIFPDGSYYLGQFHNNFAEDENGLYRSKNLQYQGGFKNNQFHGKGKEMGPSHQYKGQYYNGQKTNGVLLWKTSDFTYEYVGSFEANLFNGEGTLKQPTGLYKGEFIKGKKHGEGAYNFQNGLRFQGQYRQGQRNGKGKLYNPNGKIAYEGQFRNGLPHGQGSICGKKGEMLSAKWIEGIDSSLL